VVAQLRDGLRDGRLPQSLLLTGPRQVGKRTLALGLARAANCSGAAPPCGACRACRLSATGSYPDVHLIELREGRQKIGIAEVQALQGELSRRPSEGPRRVAVIANAERLSAEAENCLLKTLEEPPPHAILALTAEEAEALLPTTISRCRRIRLRPVASAEIAAHLGGRLGIEPERARRLAALAAGRPGWAIAAATDSGLMERYDAALERLRRATDGGKLTRLEVSRGLAEGWSGKSEQVREELRIWSAWWRDLLLAKLGLSDRLTNADRADELRREAVRFSEAELEAAVATLVQARADLDQNVNPRLALDVALISLPAPRCAA
jgi:DNA polymerase-3 subunit delta'